MSGVADPGVVKANLALGNVDVARVVTLVDVPAFAEQWMSFDVGHRGRPNVPRIKSQSAQSNYDNSLVFCSHCNLCAPGD